VPSAFGPRQETCTDGLPIPEALAKGQIVGGEILLSHTRPLYTPVISVVVPLYNEENNVKPLIERLEQVFAKLKCPWEVVFALDPSTDRTYDTIMDLVEADYPIRLITFSRRIGKPLSLIAALDHSRGDVSVVIDADLQDPPELIETMVEKWREGFDVVIARRSSRKGENYFYLKAAQTFYWLLGKISEVRVPRDTGDFRLLDSRAVREICRFRERHGFLRGITSAAGFRTTVIAYDRDPRFSGRTQISFLGALNIALDGIVPFSRVPIRLIFVLGLVLTLLGAGGGLIWAIWSLESGFSDKWPIAVLAFFFLVAWGITLAAVGTVGEYLVRTYEETRSRPLYIVDEIIEAGNVPWKLCGDSDK
jgi:glycosyltransferase involved in cell wall biosynthesis